MLQPFLRWMLRPDHAPQLRCCFGDKVCFWLAAQFCGGDAAEKFHVAEGPLSPHPHLSRVHSAQHRSLPNNKPTKRTASTDRARVHRSGWMIDSILSRRSTHVGISPILLFFIG